MIALARQHRGGLFEGGEGQLPVLGPVAVGPLSASVVSDAEIAALNIKRAEFHGEWNYTISQNTIRQIARLFPDEA